jgi:hypothetical protein
MNAIATFDDKVGLLRQLHPLKFRILELIAESMLREAQEQRGTDDTQGDERRQHHGR